MIKMKIKKFNKNFNLIYEQILNEANSESVENGEAYALDNPSASIEALKIACKDKDPDVRRRLSRRRDLPLEVLEELSEDKDTIVLHSLIHSKNVSDKILLKLAKDKSLDSWVRQAATKNIKDRRALKTIYYA